MTKTTIFNSHASLVANKKKKQRKLNEKSDEKPNNNHPQNSSLSTNNSNKIINTPVHSRPTYNSIKTIISDLCIDSDDFITKVPLNDNKSFVLNIGDKLNGITYTKGKIYEIGYAYGFLDTPSNFNNDTDKIQIISNGHGPHEYNLDKSFEYPFRTFSVKKLRGRKYYATDKFEWEFSTPNAENILFMCIKESSI